MHCIYTRIWGTTIIPLGYLLMPVRISTAENPFHRKIIWFVVKAKSFKIEFHAHVQHCTWPDLDTHIKRPSFYLLVRPNSTGQATLRVEAAAKRSRQPVAASSAVPLRRLCVPIQTYERILTCTPSPARPLLSSMKFFFRSVFSLVWADERK